MLTQRRPARRPRRAGAYLIAANDFGVYCLPRAALHRPACQAILRGKVWERETVQFLIDNAAGDIIHAGAFFGDFLPALSRAYVHVWSFEPNVDSFKCAEVTVRLNDLTNVTLRNSAVGSQPGTARLVTEHDGLSLGGGSFIADGPGDTRIETIDAVVPPDRHIGVIHFDVEGYEGLALEGASETIRRCRPILVLETVPDHVEGYEEVALLDENHILTSKSPQRPPETSEPI